MTNAVDISDFVNATLTISPIATPFQNFGLAIAIGDSSVIDVNERIQTFSTITEVEQAFGSSAPEFLAAEVFFGQSPQPAQLLIGRWARTATSGLFKGASSL
jgi:hypothetical protein